MGHTDRNTRPDAHSRSRVPESGPFPCINKPKSLDHRGLCPPCGAASRQSHIASSSTHAGLPLHRASIVVAALVFIATTWRRRRGQVILASRRRVAHLPGWISVPKHPTTTNEMARPAGPWSSRGIPTGPCGPCGPRDPCGPCGPRGPLDRLDRETVGLGRRRDRNGPVGPGPGVGYGAGTRCSEHCVRPCTVPALVCEDVDDATTATRGEFNSTPSE